MSGWRGRPARSPCSQSHSAPESSSTGSWGELDEGAALTGEAEAVSAAIGTQLAAYGAVALAALRGREAETAELVGATLDDVESRGEGMGVGICHFTAALLYNGLGRYPEAMDEAEAACEHEDLGVISWALTELIEAAARSGRARDRAECARAAFAYRAGRGHGLGAWGRGPLTRADQRG